MNKCLSSFKNEEQLTIVSSILYQSMRCKIPKNLKFFFKKTIFLESGIFYFSTLRRFLKEYHQVELGFYSYGNLNDLLAFPVKTNIGRYTSIGPGVKIFQANHPMDWPSMHPFFYRKDFGYVEQEGIERGSLQIGHDV